MKLKIILLIILVTSSLSGNCYKTTNFKGVSLNKNKNYTIEQDGISNRIINLTIDPSKSFISDSNLKCIYLSPISIVCLNNSNIQVVIETWLINNNKVQYTKSITGYPGWDTIKAFSGDIIGSCD